MKFISKGFKWFFYETNADFFCIQEAQISNSSFKVDLEKYDQYWVYCERKGYSGTAVFTKHKLLNLNYGLGFSEYDAEGCLAIRYLMKFCTTNFLLVKIWTSIWKKKLCWAGLNWLRIRNCRRRWKSYL